MSILIKGIDIPKDCIECPLEEVTVDGDGFDYWYCKITESKADTNKRPSNCPLIQIDRPHGRIGDIDCVWNDEGGEQFYDEPILLEAEE